MQTCALPTTASNLTPGPPWVLTTHTLPRRKSSRISRVNRLFPLPSAMPIILFWGGNPTYHARLISVGAGARGSGTPRTCNVAVPQCISSKTHSEHNGAARLPHELLHDIVYGVHPILSGFVQLQRISAPGHTLYHLCTGRAAG